MSELIVLGITLVFFILLFKAESRLGWVSEFLIISGVAALFIEVHVYLSVCILFFHGLGLIQTLQTQSLLGVKKIQYTIKQKIQGLIFMGLMMSLVLIELMKGEKVFSSHFLAIQTKDLANSANGEIFPYLIILGLMTALMMVGLTVERRRR